MASRTSRIDVLRGRPPEEAGINGSTRAHCSSVRSLGYRWVRMPHSTRLGPPYRTDTKRLQKKRSELVERTFAHVCETGGGRRTWLRGLAEVTKRYVVQVAAHNL